MAISANKNKGIRAAVCYNLKSTRLSRQHNNANIISLGSRLTKKNMFKISINFLKTKFEGGRHQRRVKKYNNIMSTAIKIEKLLNNFFRLNLKEADKELYNSIKR